MGVYAVVLRHLSTRANERSYTQHHAGDERFPPDVGYFTTLFHRHMGMTPGRFRLASGTRFLACGD